MGAVVTTHATTERTREVREKLCDEPTCEFRGEPAVQGVCHSTEGEIADWEKLEKAEREIEAQLVDMRREATDLDDYVRSLEAYYTSVAINWDMTLDECIRLRRENALLRRSVGDAYRGLAREEVLEKKEKEGPCPRYAETYARHQAKFTGAATGDTLDRAIRLCEYTVANPDAANFQNACDAIGVDLHSAAACLARLALWWSGDWAKAVELLRSGWAPT